MINKLKIDFNRGQIFIDSTSIAQQNLKISCLNQEIKQLLKFRKERKEITTRLDATFFWHDYRVDSIILKFKQETINSICIPFQPTPDKIYSVQNHPITQLIEKNIPNGSLTHESKSEKKYKVKFGTISIIYDIQMLAISVIIDYY